MHEGRVTVVLRPFKIVEKSDADEKLPHLTQTRRHLHSLTFESQSHLTEISINLGD